MSLMWTAIGTTAAGIGTSLYASNKASKAAQAAQNQNQANFEAQQQEDWRRYLLSRGVTSNGGTVNTRLPAWASIQRTVQPGGGLQRRLVSRVPAGLTQDSLTIGR